jgi:hypothetical protein
MQAKPTFKPLSRLVSMRQLSASMLALALGVAAAFALASCGSTNNADLLPGETASEINASLDMVRDLADSGDCTGAQDAAQQVSDQIDALTGVDKKLKQTLRDAATRLNEVVTTCVETTAPAISPATIPDSTEKTTPEPQRRETQPRDDRTTTTTTTTTPTTPTTTTPTTTTPTTPSEGGGTGAPGGVSPGSATDGQ